MKLPIFITLDITADQMEERTRDRIRHDLQIRKDLQAVSVIIFVHSLTGAVGVMYGAEYAKHSDRYEVVLNLMGWKWDRAFQAPTPHASKLRSVK